jgi:hypothetical protein
VQAGVSHLQVAVLQKSSTSTNYFVAPAGTFPVIGTPYKLCIAGHKSAISRTIGSMNRSKATGFGLSSWACSNSQQRGAILQNKPISAAFSMTNEWRVYRLHRISYVFTARQQLR